VPTSSTSVALALLTYVQFAPYDVADATAAVARAANGTVTPATTGSSDTVGPLTGGAVYVTLASAGVATNNSTVVAAATSWTPPDETNTAVTVFVGTGGSLLAWSTPPTADVTLRDATALAIGAEYIGVYDDSSSTTAGNTSATPLALASTPVWVAAAYGTLVDADDNYSVYDAIYGQYAPDDALAARWGCMVASGATSLPSVATCASASPALLVTERVGTVQCALAAFSSASSWADPTSSWAVAVPPTASGSYSSALLTVAPRGPAAASVVSEGPDGSDYRTCRDAGAGTTSTFIVSLLGSHGHALTSAIRSRSTLFANGQPYVDAVVVSPSGGRATPTLIETQVNGTAALNASVAFTENYYWPYYDVVIATGRKHRVLFRHATGGLLPMTIGSGSSLSASLGVYYDLPDMPVAPTSTAPALAALNTSYAVAFGALTTGLKRDVTTCMYIHKLDCTGMSASYPSVHYCGYLGGVALSLPEYSLNSNAGSTDTYYREVICTDTTTTGALAAGNYTLTLYKHTESVVATGSTVVTGCPASVDLSLSGANFLSSRVLPVVTALPGSASAADTVIFCNGVQLKTTTIVSLTVGVQAAVNVSLRTAARAFVGASGAGAASALLVAIGGDGTSGTEVGSLATYRYNDAVANSLALSQSVVDYGNGNYTVYFTPRVAGQFTGSAYTAAQTSVYKLSVWLYGVYLGTNPSRVRVAAGAFSASLSYVRGTYAARSDYAYSTDDVPQESTYSAIAGRRQQLEVWYRDAYGNAKSYPTGSPPTFALSFSGPAPLLGAGDPLPWTTAPAFDGDGCVTVACAAASVGTPIMGYLCYTCSLAGFYNVTVTSGGVTLRGGSFSLQVLPDRPYEGMSTLLGPPSLMLGSCADVYVRLRDRYGNGFAENVTDYFERKFQPYLWGSWYRHADPAADVPAALAVDPTDDAALAAAGVPSVRATRLGPIGNGVTNRRYIQNYAGGGAYRLRACAFGGPGVFTAGATYWLRVVMSFGEPCVADPVAGCQDELGISSFHSYGHMNLGPLTGYTGSGTPGVDGAYVVTLLGGPPHGFASWVEPADLAGATAAGSPRSFRLYLRDKLGHACGSATAALNASAAGEPAHVRGYVVAPSGSAPSAVSVAVYDDASCTASITLTGLQLQAAGDYTLRLAVGSSVVSTYAGGAAAPSFTVSSGAPAAASSFVGGVGSVYALVSPAAAGGSFAVYVRDAYGNPTPLSALSDVAAVIYRGGLPGSPGAAQYAAPTFEATGVVGTYRGNYSLNATGVYALTVALGGVPLAVGAGGVSYSVLGVVTAADDPARYCVTGFGASAVPAAAAGVAAGAPCPAVTPPPLLRAGSVLRFSLAARDTLGGEYVSPTASSPAGERVVVQLSLETGGGGGGAPVITTAYPSSCAWTPGVVTCALPSSALTTAGVYGVAIGVEAANGTATVFYTTPVGSSVTVIPAAPSVSTSALFALGASAQDALSPALEPQPLPLSAANVTVAAGSVLWVGLALADAYNNSLTASVAPGDGGWCALEGHAGVSLLPAGALVVRGLRDGGGGGGGSDGVDATFPSAAALCGDDPALTDAARAAVQAAQPGLLVGRLRFTAVGTYRVTLSSANGGDAAVTLGGTVDVVPPACSAAHSAVFGDGTVQAVAGAAAAATTTFNFTVRLAPRGGAVPSIVCHLYTASPGGGAVLGDVPLNGSAVGAPVTADALCVSAPGCLPSAGCGAPAAAAAAAAVTDPATAPRLTVSAAPGEPGAFLVGVNVTRIAYGDFAAASSALGVADAVANVSVTLGTADGPLVSGRRHAVTLRPGPASVARSAVSLLAPGAAPHALVWAATVGSGPTFSLPPPSLPACVPLGLVVHLTDAWGNALLSPEANASWVEAAATLNGTALASGSSVTAVDGAAYLGVGRYLLPLQAPAGGQYAVTIAYRTPASPFGENVTLLFNATDAPTAADGVPPLRLFSPPPAAPTCTAGADCVVTLPPTAAALAARLSTFCFAATAVTPLQQLVLPAPNATVDGVTSAVTLRFNASLTGNQTVRVYASGILCAPPFTVTVAPAAPQPSASLLLGPCIRRTTAGAAFTPYVLLRDAYGNAADAAAVAANVTAVVSLQPSLQGGGAAGSNCTAAPVAGGLLQATCNVTRSGAYTMSAAVFTSGSGDPLGTVTTRHADTLVTGATPAAAAALAVVPAALDLAAANFSVVAVSANATTDSWTATAVAGAVSGDNALSIVVTPADSPLFAGGYWAVNPAVVTPWAAALLSPAIDGTYVQLLPARDATASGAAAVTVALVALGDAGNLTAAVASAAGARHVTSVNLTSGAALQLRLVDSGTTGEFTLAATDVRGSPTTIAGAPSVTLHAYELALPGDAAARRSDSAVSVAVDGSVSIAPALSSHYRRARVVLEALAASGSAQLAAATALDLSNTSVTAALVYPTAAAISVVASTAPTVVLALPGALLDAAPTVLNITLLPAACAVVDGGGIVTDALVSGTSGNCTVPALTTTAVISPGVLQQRWLQLAAPVAGSYAVVAAAPAGTLQLQLRVYPNASSARGTDAVNSSVVATTAAVSCSINMATTGVDPLVLVVDDPATACVGGMSLADALGNGVDVVDAGLSPPYAAADGAVLSVDVLTAQRRVPWEAPSEAAWAAMPVVRSGSSGGAGVLTLPGGILLNATVRSSPTGRLCGLRVTTADGNTSAASATLDAAVSSSITLPTTLLGGARYYVIVTQCDAATSVPLTFASVADAAALVSAAVSGVVLSLNPLPPAAAAAAATTNTDIVPLTAPPAVAVVTAVNGSLRAHASFAVDAPAGGGVLCFSLRQSGWDDTSGVCIDVSVGAGTDTCPAVPRCPQSLPSRCWDGSCAPSAAACAAAVAEQQRAGGLAGAAFAAALNDTAAAASQQLLTNTSGGVNLVTLWCPSEAPVACAGGGCAVSAALCPPFPVCPPDYTLCAVASEAVVTGGAVTVLPGGGGGRCVPSPADCGTEVPDNGAAPLLVNVSSSSAGAPCSDGSAIVVAGASTACVSALPAVTTPSGSVVIVNATLAAVQCADGYVRCTGGECVPSWAWPSGCPTRVSCGRGRHMCADGACYADDPAATLVAYLRRSAGFASAVEAAGQNESVATAAACPSTPFEPAATAWRPVCPPPRPYACEDGTCAPHPRLCLAGLVARYEDLTATALLAAAADVAGSLSNSSTAQLASIVSNASAVLVSLAAQLHALTACPVGYRTLPDGSCTDAAQLPTGGPAAAAAWLTPPCPSSAPLLCDGASACVVRLEDCPPRAEQCNVTSPVFCAARQRCVTSRSACDPPPSAWQPPVVLPPTSVAAAAACPSDAPFPCLLSGLCMTAAQRDSGFCKPLLLPAEAARVTIDGNGTQLLRQLCPPSAPLLCASGDCVRSYIGAYVTAATAAAVPLGACPLLPGCNASAPVRCVGGPCVAAVDDCGGGGSKSTALAVGVNATGDVVVGAAAAAPAEAAVDAGCPPARPWACVDGSNSTVTCFGEEPGFGGWSSAARACFAPADAAVAADTAADADDCPAAAASATVNTTRPAYLQQGACAAGSVLCPAAPTLQLTRKFGGGTCVPDSEAWRCAIDTGGDAAASN
jgi:hypothetical protein